LRVVSIKGELGVYEMMVCSEQLRLHRAFICDVGQNGERLVAEQLTLAWRR